LDKVVTWLIIHHIGATFNAKNYLAIEKSKSNYNSHFFYHGQTTFDIDSCLVMAKNLGPVSNPSYNLGFFYHHHTTLNAKKYSTSGGKWGKRSNLNSSLDWPWLKNS
jgi:hypothetical protein